MVNILTWNINGIRSSKRDLLQSFQNLDADIICLQETKITRDMLDEATALINGYTSYYGFCKKRPGYSGVATYCKDSVLPHEAEEGITGQLNGGKCRIGCCEKLQQHFTDEELRELDAEGRCVLTCHTVQDSDSVYSLVIINVYCPRADEDNENRLGFKMKFYQALQLRCEDLLERGFQVIVLGDINSCHKRIDHCEPEDIPEFEKAPGRQWLDQFLQVSLEHEKRFIDSFRYLYPNKEKCFTCWNTKLNARVNNYGTRIDYILLSPKIVPKLQDCIILSDIQGSDHCPVKAIMNINILPSSKVPNSCTKFYKEFAGKQQKLLKFVCKRTLSVELESSDSESQLNKKLKSTASSKPKQQSLLTFFAKPKISIETESSDVKIPVIDTDTLKELAPSTETAQLWKNVLKGPPQPPLCRGHSQPCVLRTVKKKGPNLNRQFWACSKSAGHSSDPEAQCNFFQWASTRR